MKVTNELKLCPFCGGNAYLMSYPPIYFVRCEKCGSQTHIFKARCITITRECDAIEAWNRRVSDDIRYKQ